MNKHNSKAPPTAFSVVFCLLIPLFFAVSCANHGNPIVVIKTNRSEFAAYAELFNKEQDTWKAMVVFSENPAEELLSPGMDADIVAGPWIKGEKTRSKLIPLTYLFNERKLDGSIFYRSLLELGNTRGTQFSLPVSFNLPALIFSQEHRALMREDPLIDFAEIQELSKSFNEMENGAYTRMAFSPRWDAEFLYTTTQMMNADFHESENIFSWNEKNLRDAIIFLRNWESEINTSAAAVEDFKFKYLYIPLERAATGGRILFAQTYTNELFSGTTDNLRQLDFRWPAHNRKIPMKDEIIYLGICRGTKNRAAAEAFVSWFFSVETQQRIMEYSREVGMLDNSFGIANGFSSIKSVNERIFPLYYPDLLGKMPEEDQLKIPEILPNDWEEIRQEILLPFLSEIIAAEDAASVPSLSERIERREKTH